MCPLHDDSPALLPAHLPRPPARLPACLQVTAEALAFSETQPAAGGPLHTQQQPPQQAQAEAGAPAAAALDSGVHHNSFVEPHPEAAAPASDAAPSGSASASAAASAALLEDPVVREVLSFWTYYRGCGYEREAMAQWVAQVMAAQW